MNAKTLLAYLHLFKVGMVEGCRQSLRRFVGGGGVTMNMFLFFSQLFCCSTVKRYGG